MSGSGSLPTLGRTLRYDGTVERASVIDVPVEMAVNIVYGNLPYAVMMLTPDDIEDFVVGFSRTEGVIDHPGEIRAIVSEHQADGLIVKVDLVPEAMRRHLARRRNMSGRTSCGLCGIESLEQLPGASAPVTGTVASPDAIGRALHLLGQYQPVHARTHGVHAAAWCDMNGGIVLAREDVGRHNALDKMIGACLRAGCIARDGFVIITSRCSFEMIEKAAIFGAPTLVAISAPTSLAIERARAMGVTLVAVARPDKAIAFSPLPAFTTKALAS